MNNIMLLTDSYKVTHWKQYPPKTEKVYSYLESRGGDFDKVVFFGLQYFLDKYLTGRVVTREKIAEAQDYFDQHLGPGLFNSEGWKHILEVHNGHLPVEIKAVSEGMVVPSGNVLMTIENLDPKCWWLTNYLETLLVQVWYPITVATISRYCKEIILKSLVETGDPSLIPFKLHDFGFRGVSSVESAGIGGAAHLVNFMGTDTVAALHVARKYYGEEMAGFSIPAAEHSTITSWGEENEAVAFENMLDQFSESPLVAVVSDSYDIYNAAEKIWGEELKVKVLARKGTLVIRPDSGNPPEVVVNLLTILGRKFGYETNEKGYKVLPPQVRIIQGDGINHISLKTILEALERTGWSADNIAFGMGGGLLQQCNRDTLRFAFKCSSITVDGIERDVYKKPITDPGKNSKRGRLKLVRIEGAHGAVYTTEKEGDSNRKDLLSTVFEAGMRWNRQTFSDIRANAEVRV